MSELSEKEIQETIDTTLLDFADSNLNFESCVAKRDIECREEILVIFELPIAQSWLRFDYEGAPPEIIKEAQKRALAASGLV